MELNTPLYKCHLTPKFQKSRRKTKFQQNLTIGNTGPPAGGITAAFADSVKRTLKTSRNKINQIRKFPHHQPLPKSSSENFEKVKIRKNAITFLFFIRTSSCWSSIPHYTNVI